MAAPVDGDFGQPAVGGIPAAGRMGMAGGGPGGAGVSAGGSRGSKAPKKKDDDDSLYTTVMLRNIPNKYTQQMLIEQLHRSGFRGDIDYLYLPIDFANRCNCGYCFVNFRTVVAREKFASVFHDVAVQSCLPGFNSYKVCQVTRAKWQGREENVRRLRSGPELMAQLAAHPDWLPLLLDEAGTQEQFPLDTPGQGAAPAPRRQSRKGGGGPSAVGLQAFPGFFAEGFPEPPPFMGGGGCRGGKGAGKGGGRGRRGVGRGGGGPPAGFFGGCGLPFAGYAGMPGLPVMTEQGMTYLPYGCGAYAGFSPGAYIPPPCGAAYGGPTWYGSDEASFGLGGGYDGDWQQQDSGPGGSPRRVDLGHDDDA